MSRWLVILFLIAGCATVYRGGQSDPPTPPLPSSPPLVDIAATSQARILSFLIQPRHVAYTWDYPQVMPAENISFDLEGSVDLINWYLIQTTNQPPVRFDTYQWSEYYRVGAHWIIDPN